MATVAVVAASGAPAAVGGQPAASGGRDGTVAVVVRKRTPDDPLPLAAVRRLGGRVTRLLPIVDGFAARLPAAAVSRLRTTPGVRSVTPDQRVHVADAVTSDAGLSVYPDVVRADVARAAGLTGEGVTVALVDTGVTEVPDLAGRMVTVTDDRTGATSPCVNLSGESTCDDSYGHGTFLAGLIAGNGAASGGRWQGVAPGAHIVSVKLAGRDGSADVSNLLAAIQWVVSFRDRYGIRVVNLSLGTDSSASWRTDPLNYAVERAWAAGIVVVVSASNRGPAGRTIAKPGDDPWVITVGAIDDRGTPGLGDDRLPDFSARGPTAGDGLRKPDVVAPGGHLISLRAPGSQIDALFPHYVDGAYRRGSGTSMSTAVTTGVVALLLEARPTTTPNRVKFALTATARPAASDDVLAVGAGVVDAYGASFAAPLGLANIGLGRSSGLGALDPSRGSLRVALDDPFRTVVEGVLTAQLLTWDPLGYTLSLWLPDTWYQSTWYTAPWYGSNWHGSNWHGSNWHGATWYGTRDAGASYGDGWHGSTWYGAWE